MTATPPSPKDSPILAKFRAALNAIYGERIERVVLYGSQARGEARPDSDYDVAVFLIGTSDPYEERSDRISQPDQERSALSVGPADSSFSSL